MMLNMPEIVKQYFQYTVIFYYTGTKAMHRYFSIGDPLFS